MKHVLPVLAFAALAACAETPPDIAISDAVVRTPNPARDVTAGYVILTNRGGPDRLLAAASASASAIELHTHINDDGIMRMRQIDSVALPRGETRFAPGGLHMMIFGLGALNEGETIEITLDFERSPDQAVTFVVGQPAL